MNSQEIRKWQDNFVEDLVDEIKVTDIVFKENLVNSVLEVAFQLSEIRLAIDRKSFSPNITMPVPDKVPIPVPDKYFNAKGEIDLSQVTGEEARNYFINVLGVKFPIGVTKVKQR